MCMRNYTRGSYQRVDSSSDQQEKMSDGLLPKPHTTSPVSAHFGFEPDKEGKAKTTDTATCGHCKKHVKSKGSNTTNLFSHLKVHHPMKYAEMARVRQSQTSNEESSSSSKISSSQVTIKEALEKCKKWEELTDSVTYCLAKDVLPMYSVEKEGFRKMLYNFNPQYELPGRKHFSEVVIPTLFTNTRERVAAEVQTAHF